MAMRMSNKMKYEEIMNLDNADKVREIVDIIENNIGELWHIGESIHGSALCTLLQDYNTEEAKIAVAEIKRVLKSLKIKGKVGYYWRGGNTDPNRPMAICITLTRKNVVESL